MQGAEAALHKDSVLYAPVVNTRQKVVYYSLRHLAYICPFRHKACTSVLAARARGTFLCNTEPARTIAHGEPAEAPPAGAPSGVAAARCGREA